jgi:(E)-4-hydroxy-3-methylbut-2-enyl-diphosphate synthase
VKELSMTTPVVPAELSSASVAARKRSVAVHVGSVTIGGGAPIVVQSMTNTDTADVEATAR